MVSPTIAGHAPADGPSLGHPFGGGTMKNTQQIPVTERALAARIDRKLNQEGSRLKKARPGTRANLDLGDYYVVNSNEGGAWPTHVDLEEYGRELGVLRTGEKLVTE